MQAQVPHNNNHNADSDIEGKSTRGDSNNSNHSSSAHDHSRGPSNFSTSDNGNLVYDPGGNGIDTKDGLTYNDSTSTSTSYVSRTADAHCNFDRDRDKFITSPSSADAVPPIDFVPAIPVLDVTSPRPTNNLPTILHHDSTYTDATSILPLFNA